MLHEGAFYQAFCVIRRARGSSLAAKPLMYKGIRLAAASGRGTAVRWPAEPGLWKKLKTNSNLE
jgi:hypothetical protein